MPRAEMIQAGAVAAVAVLLGLISWQGKILLAIGILFLILLVGGALALGQRAIHMLNSDDQLLIEGFTGTTVHNGPGVVALNPFSYRAATIRKAETLGNLNFVVIRDAMEGSERIEQGPKLLFLKPYDQVVSRGEAHSLGSTDYVIVTDKLSGQRTVVKGPCTWFPGPHDEASRGVAISLTQTEYIFVQDQLTGDRTTVKGPRVWFPKPFETAASKQMALALQEDEYIRLKDASSGRRWVQKGKALVFLEPTWRIEGANSKEPNGVKKAWSLKAYEYIRLVDNILGKVTTHRGEKTVFPGPDEELLDGEVLRAIDLKVHEYVKILDQATGEIRVESVKSTSGSTQVFLGPNDKALDGGKQKAVEVDDEHAVLVRDKATGQLRLVTEKQLFVPGPNEIIEEVRELIKLADHEAMIIKDQYGSFQYFYGSEAKRAANQPRSFFLPPFAEVVQLCWSRGRKRETRDLYIKRFDCRAQFMSFEFSCRTADNVELILEGTFFWEVVDLPTMVRTTGDTPGDLCNHARSQFIKHVAKVTLKQFMDTSHALAKSVWEDDTEFYTSRGVKIHSLEVTRYQCADRNTSEILEQIIQETTNRMNRLSQAESENEVNLFRTQGLIEQEKMQAELLKIKHEYAMAEAEVTGRAEANRIKAFVAGLNDAVPKLEERIQLWQVLRKQEALTAVAQGGATLYYTPNDVNLSIETRK